MIIFQKERDGSIRGASENENSISLFPWKLWNMKAASPLQNLAINCIFTAALRMRAGLSGRRRRRWHKKGKEKRKFLLVAGTLSAGDDAIIFLAFCPHALNFSSHFSTWISLIFVAPKIFTTSLISEALLWLYFLSIYLIMGSFESMCRAKLKPLSIGLHVITLYLFYSI